MSKQLGLKEAKDDGQVPDVTSQLLELKLQTSPTIDLGLISPGSTDELEMGSENEKQRLSFADIRYGVFYGTPVDNQIRLEQLVLTTGADFYCFFKRLEGNVVNKKNQIRLPKGFFESE